MLSDGHRYVLIRVLPTLKLFVLSQYAAPGLPTGLATGSSLGPSTFQFTWSCV